MSNETTYKDCKCKQGEKPISSDYVHNSSTPLHCCDNDKCECHHPLRLWAIKYEVVGVPKFSGVAVVQAKDLCNAQYVFIQNSKFNGFREYIHITCIEELYPNPEPIILLEDSAAIIDRRMLKTYPWVTKEDFCKEVTKIYEEITEHLGEIIIDCKCKCPDPEPEPVEVNYIDYLHDVSFADGVLDITTYSADVEIETIDYLNDVSYADETLTFSSATINTASQYADSINDANYSNNILTIIQKTNE